MRAVAIASLIVLSLAGALAHEFVRDGDVAALMHVEPDDAVTAAKPTTAWFELTKRGGEMIGEADCDCRVGIYAGAIKPGATPIQAVAAKDGTAGRAKGKLSATLTFPDEGAYTLTLDGKPRKAGAFKPFLLEWTVRAEATPGSHAH
jgi:hypothetical protein